MRKKFLPLILISCFIFLSGCFYETVTIERTASQYYGTHKSANDAYYLFYNQQDLYNEKIYEQLLPILKAKHIVITDNLEEAQYALTFSYLVKDYSYTSTKTTPIYAYNGYNRNVIGVTTSNSLNLQFAHGIILSAYQINKESFTLSNKIWEIISVMSADHSDFLKSAPTLLLALHDYIFTDKQGRYEIKISDDKIISQKEKN